MESFKSENISANRGVRGIDSYARKAVLRHIDAQEKRENLDKQRHKIDMKKVLAGNKIVEWIEKRYEKKEINLTMRNFIIRMNWDGVLTKQEIRDLKMTDEEKTAFIDRCIDRHNRRLENSKNER